MFARGGPGQSRKNVKYVYSELAATSTPFLSSPIFAFALGVLLPPFLRLPGVAPGTSNVSNGEVRNLFPRRVLRGDYVKVQYN